MSFDQPLSDCLCNSLCSIFGAELSNSAADIGVDSIVLISGHRSDFFAGKSPAGLGQTTQFTPRQS